MSRHPARAMVLAAGLGLRMRPLTLDRPKPLIELAGRTLLDRVLDALAAAGIEEAVVNSHYLGAMIAARVARRTRPRITLSPEETLLDTGGGVARALPRLGKGPFFVINADIAWDDGPRPALVRLATAWRDTTMDALLLVQPASRAVGYDGPGDFDLADGKLVRRSGDRAAFVFTGVQLLHPRLFAQAPAGAFSLNLLYDRAATAGRLCGLVHDGAWYHIGTPAALKEAEALIRP